MNECRNINKDKITYTKKNDRIPVPWWSDNCKQKLKNPSDIEAYKITKSTANKVIEETKRDIWRDYCSTLTDRIDSRKV